MLRFITNNGRYFQAIDLTKTFLLFNVEKYR